MIRIEVESGAAQSAAIKMTRMRGRLRRVVREVLKAGKSEAAKRIRARYERPSIGISALKVRVNDLNGTLRSSGARNPLIKFIVRPNTRPPHNPPGGIYVRVVKGQGGFLPHAFIGMKQVLERKGAMRMPIRSLLSISAPGMVGNDKVRPAILSRIEERLQEELGRVFE